MRLVNRVLALVVAVVLAAAGVVLAIEVVAQRLDRAHIVVDWQSWYRWAHRTNWNSGVVRTICIVLVVVGALLLIAELIRPRASRLAINTTDPSTDAAVTRRGVAGTVHAAVRAVDGVTGASVTVRPRRVRVEATAAGQDDALFDQLRQPITDAAQGRLDSLRLQRPPTLSVHVSSRSR